MEKREDYLKQHLTSFVQKRSSDVSLCGIDEIVLSYLVSILEQLGSDDAGQDLFDVEEFTEMMEAYLPGFGHIDSVTVSEWMFELANKLNNFGNQDDCLPQPINNSTPFLVPMTTNGHKSPQLTDNTQTMYAGFQTPNNPFRDLLARPLSLPSGDPSSVARPSVVDPRPRTQSWSTEVTGRGQRSRTVSSSSSHGNDRRRNLSTSSSTCSSETLNMNGDIDLAEYDDFEAGTVAVLQEMFPRACSMEVNHCLTVSHGNTENAAQLMLARQDAGHSLSEQSSKKKSKKSGSKKSCVSILDDHRMKETIISKYSYVDVDADQKEHKPAAPKTQDKKLIRYLDGRIVSTRGERFTEIKKDDDEKMKKTYVNLKPAKQYRFH